LLVNETIAAKFDGPKLRIHSGSSVGANPELPGLAPVRAIETVLGQERINVTQLRCAEVMEAYAAQAIACIERAGLNASICNLGGGGLARGHPIGASGAVLGPLC